ncbi:hypothetical protein JT05_06300 [Desulfosporosinus sp. Tol-M]|nr:hypothetical protein JT05_06300 [Desulfosporosinus sp. Tol-M]
MIKKLLVVGALTTLLITVSIGISYQNYYADQKKSVEEYIKLGGEFIKNNPELLSKSLEVVENKLVNYEDVVSNVDLLPISIAEIEFRKGINQAAGFGDMDDKAIFNILVEEKLIMSYAIKNNVLPTKNEIDDFIKSERLVFEKTEEFQKFINNFCTAANMSMEDYWNTYEYYNAFRIVTFKKAYDYSIETGIKKGELRDLKSDKYTLNSDITSEYDKYWIKIKKEMKNMTSLKVNKQYSNRGFILDNSKLYTFGGEV